MSLANKLQNVYTNLSAALTNANAALVEKGGSEVATFTALGDEIREISGGSEDFKALIEGESIDLYNDEVTTIADYAFYAHTNVITVNFPACTTIGSTAFRSCFSLTTADFPACTTIGSEAFRSCFSLATANFPVCKTLEPSAFYSCTRLTTVNLPLCENLQRYAFAACTSLEIADFPACKAMSSRAFDACYGLESISFSQCSKIDQYAFVNCSYLISFKNTYSSVATLNNSNAFMHTPMSSSYYAGTLGSIYVPASLVDAYKAATNWATYADRITSI